MEARAINAFDGLPVDVKSFAYSDLLGQDRWLPFTPSFTLTVVGTPTYVGRFRVVGRQLFFQVSMVSTTSIAATAGTSYMTLPITAKGISGVAVMQNLTTNIAVGVCVLNASASKCYLPAQSASGNTFSISGSYEI